MKNLFEDLLGYNVHVPGGIEHDAGIFRTNLIPHLMERTGGVIRLFGDYKLSDRDFNIIARIGASSQEELYSKKELIESTITENQYQLRPAIMRDDPKLGLILEPLPPLG